MSDRRPLHVAAKALLVVMSTAAGASAGGFVGLAFVAITMPNAGLEGILPPAVGALLGAAAGCFVELALLYKLPRVPRERATGVAAACGALTVTGAVGLIALRSSTPEPAWAVVALAALPMAVFGAIALVSSRLYGPTQRRGDSRAN